MCQAFPALAYNPFVNEEGRDAFFDFEQAIVLDFEVDRVKEVGMLTLRKNQDYELKRQVCFECGSWDGSLKSMNRRLREFK